MLSCHLPPSDPGSVSMVVANLDDAGVPIPGETATKLNAVTYARPDLSAEDDGSRVERALQRLLKRQVLDNVLKLGISPDFGDAPFVVTEQASYPGLVLTGPRCREDRPHWCTQRRIAVPSSLGAGLVDIKARPVTFELEYTISGFTKNGAQATSLMFLTRRVLEKAGYLEVQRDKDDAGKGTIRYQMIVPAEAEFRDTSSPNKDGMHSFDGLTVVIHGVNLEDIAGFPGQSLEKVGIGAQEEFALLAIAKR